MLSPIGRRKVAAHICLWLVNAIVLALAARVNSFQEYFFVADLLPFGLSITTLVLLTLMLALDFSFDTSYTGRPQFEIGFFGVLSVLWLAFNAFSTSRWSQVPMSCNTIPAELTDIRGWCINLQVLKALVWVEWLIVLGLAIFTATYSFSQYSRGHKHVFKVPFSRFQPQQPTTAFHPTFEYQQHDDGEFSRHNEKGQWPVKF